MEPQTQRWISYGVTALIMIVVLGLRFRSMAKVRPLKLNRLWILPVLYAVIAGSVFYSFPPEPRGWAYALIGFLIGLVLGWKRGEMMQIEIDPASNGLTQKASPAAMLFIVVIIVARMGSRLFMGSEAGSVDGGLHGTTLMVTDILIASALGFLTAQRVEMYQRGKKLLSAGRVA